MHNTLCQALGLCRYEQRADPAQDLLILGLNGAVLSKPGQPKVLLARPANATIAQCITARPALLTKHHSLWGKVRRAAAAAEVAPRWPAVGGRWAAPRRARPRPARRRAPGGFPAPHAAPAALQVILLREAWAGIGPACRAMGCR